MVQCLIKYLAEILQLELNVLELSSVSLIAPRIEGVIYWNISVACFLSPSLDNWEIKWNCVLTRCLN